MYATEIIQRRRESYERTNNVKLREVEIPRAREIATYLQGKPNAKGEIIRPRITPELRAFIDNELAMCKASFLYWARRYAQIEYRIGRGGIDYFEPLESQLILLEKMAKVEIANWYRKDQGDIKFQGIRFIIHKARQLGFTTLCQLLLLHLTIFYADVRTLSASVDDQKTQDMHAKWNLAYERLPWWQQTPILTREKDRGKILANGGYCALQDFAQEGGLGQGMTWTAAHLTELAAVDDDYCKEQVQNHFMPSISDALRVIAFMESTAQGAGNWWNQIWDMAWANRLSGWHPCFVPVYAEPTRWSSPFIPEGWEPKEETKAYAEKIRQTSYKYMDRVVDPDQKHLHWWEEKYSEAVDSGTLNLFLANYCATAEESFQYSDGGAFNPQIIVSLESRVDRPPVAYELVTTPSQRQDVRARMNKESKIYSVGGADLVPVHTTDRDVKDPRGLILLFEPPRIDVIYSLGADPAVGITGWNRRFRSDESSEIDRDNACLSGWYKDPKTGLAVQAFEYAGPISAREFATYCYVMGKMYSGANGPDRGSSIIIELNNGGIETQNILVNDFKYYTLWQRTKFDGVKNKQTEQWGWVSGNNVKELWVHAKDNVEQPSLPIRPRSRYLLQEMRLARWDLVKQRGFVPEGNGQHDDRICAMLFAMWQLRGFMSFGSYGDTAKALAGDQQKSGIDFQRMDIASRGEYDDAVDVWYNRVLYG